MKNKQEPEFRFSGFIGNWQQHTLGDISKKVTEKNKDNIYTETFTNSAEFGIVTQRDFFEKDISNKKNINGYYIVHPDYFVYNPRISTYAPVGPIKRNKLGRTGIMSPLYYVFHTHDVDKTYLEYYFSGNTWHIFMKLNGDSGARSDRFSIKDSVFREMPIPIPLEEEQEKIGNFFKELDDTIAIHELELDTLKQTKQGFLQKMFPKEGETVPDIRFPGFTRDWEQQKLSDFAHKAVDNRGKTPPLDSNGTHPLIEVASLGTGSPDYSKVEKYLNDYSFEHHLRNYIKKGDILFSTVGRIGLVSLMDDQENAAIAQNIVAFRAKEQYSSEYLYALFSTESNKAKAYRIVMGAVQPSIKVSQLVDVEYFVTKDKREQELIGTFFLQLDNLITLYQQKLETLKQTKKAFLQKMFV